MFSPEAFEIAARMSELEKLADKCFPGCRVELKRDPAIVVKEYEPSVKWKIFKARILVEIKKIDDDTTEEI